MTIRSLLGILAVTLTFNYQTPLHAATLGSQATLSDDFHDVGGTATVLDFDRLRIDDFTYDGQGLDVFFYLGADDTNAAFIGGLSVGPQLLGTVFDGTQAPIIIEMPAGTSTADYGAISVWCTAVSVSFGSSTFVEIPEPSATGLALVALGACALARRRRNR
jgi:MYXO-CTERM domain-containing protein